MLNRPDISRIDLRRLLGYGFALGMVLAPFVALLYGWNAGLAVMTCALAATTYLAIDALRTADSAFQPRLRMMAGMNAALTIACLGLLLMRLLS